MFPFLPVDPVLSRPMPTTDRYDFFRSNRQMLGLMFVQKTKLNLSGFPIHNAVRRNRNQTNALEQISNCQYNFTGFYGNFNLN
jgi:hypothetical protein